MQERSDVQIKRMVENERMPLSGDGKSKQTARKLHIEIKKKMKRSELNERTEMKRTYRCNKWGMRGAGGE